MNVISILRHHQSNLPIVVFDMTEGVGAYSGKLAPDTTPVTFEKSEGWVRE